MRAHSPTLKWYGVLAHNEQILAAAWLSIRIALTAASAAVVLGTLAGVALARFGAFRGRMLLAGMVTAPIVMPEVITGLSLLLLFVALGQLIGWPQGRRRGHHRARPHHLLHGLRDRGGAVAPRRLR